MTTSQTLPSSRSGGPPAPTGKPIVGYKHPPADKRFEKGKSGNPKGRAKGTPNVADILKKVFNEKRRVREGNRVRLMPTCEAVIRLAVIKAQSGNARALTTVLAILDKLGATTDVTSDERQDRTIKLPRAPTMAEYDLLYAAAREKERQHYRAIVERHEETADDVAGSLIRSGDNLADEGKFDDAWQAYCQQIADCAGELAAKPDDSALQSLSKRAIARLGLLAEQVLITGHFAQALQCAEEAITHGAGLDLRWIQLIRAHAKMFLGRGGEARDFYLNFQSKKNEMFTSWETVILRDFTRLQTAGHAHPLMMEIEKKLVAAGWTAQGRRIETAAAPTINADDQQFIMLNPDHVQTAALLADHGKLDEAADVYRRNLAKCQARLAKEPRHAETQQRLGLVAVRLGVLAEQFIYRGRFATALELAQKLIAVAPERYQLHAICAHALMFLGREDDAQALYLRYRGQKLGSELWEAGVLADFNKLRQAGRSQPLMDKVERLFESKDWLQSTDSPPLQNNTIASEVSTPPADDIPAGDRLAEEGKFDEALDVYCRRIEISQAKLINGRVNLQAIEDRQSAIERMSDLAFAFMLQRDFQKSIAVADKAIGVLPNSTSPNLRRAHALMLLNRTDEARTLYHRFGVGKATPELTWHDIVRQDFVAMRNAGLCHALMAEIEKES